MILYLGALEAIGVRSYATNRTDWTFSQEEQDDNDRRSDSLDSEMNHRPIPKRSSEFR